MFRNYFVTVYRNLLRNKSLTTINILGLGVGFALALLMLVYVVYENSFDGFHKNKERIFRISLRMGNGMFPSTMPALGPAVRSSVPGIETACRIRNDRDAEFSLPNDEKTTESNFYFAEQGMLDIFTFPFISGDKARALVRPFSIILCRSKAKKYFGDENPLGKTLTIKENPYTVTGVYRDLPQNTHLRCEIAASYSSLESLGESLEDPWNNWGDDMTYILIKDIAPVEDIARAVAEVAKKNINPIPASRLSFELVNVTSIHWRTDYFFDIGTKGNKTYLRIFLITALLILVIACFNFMNLSTAKYLDKSKEVGIRKVIGASRIQIAKLFLTESFSVAGIGLALGCALFILFKNDIYGLLGATIDFNKSLIAGTMGLVASLLILASFFAGSYPAYFLSKFNPAQTSRGFVSIERNFSFRQISTILQFAFSAFLVLGILVVNSQIGFMKNADIGMQKDNILLLYPKWNKQESERNYELFKTEIEKNGSAKEIVGAYSLPGTGGRFSASAKKVSDPSARPVSCQLIPADINVVEAFKMRLLQGRGFSPNLTSDRTDSVILNETAVRAFGFANPIGEKLSFMQKQVRVIGVVKDFHVASLRRKVNACIIMANPEYYQVYALQIDGTKTRESIAKIKETWQSVFPDMEFQYKFLNDVYRALYASEDNMSRGLALFAVLTLFVTCIGLFGFSQYLAERKIKEIGIRKVLGASITDMLVLFSGKIVIWVAIACGVGIPLSVYFSARWLREFAYRIPVDPFLVLISFALTLVIAVGTICFQAVKSSCSNPVDSIRNE